MTVFVEYIRKKLGWCPNAAAAGTARRRYAAPGGEVGIEAVAGDGREMMEDIFVEYVSPRFIYDGQGDPRFQPGEELPASSPVHFRPAGVIL